MVAAALVFVSRVRPETSQKSSTANAPLLLPEPVARQTAAGRKGLPFKTSASAKEQNYGW